MALNFRYFQKKKNNYIIKKLLVMGTTASKTKKASTASAKSSTHAKSASSKSSAGNGSMSKANGKKGAESEPLLEEFFVDMLKDIYWAEKHLTKALPKMKKAATSEDLQQAFEDHLAQTEEHVARLEQAFEMMGKKAQAKKCDAMEGLTKEAESIIEETEEGSMTRDVALIVAAQKVEHYEIATYGSLVQIANTMNMGDVASIFEQTLQEEKDTDVHLTEIAVNNINQKAEDEGEGGEEETEDQEDDEEMKEDNEK
jgi:ferritin-like metal-binding protein YciE